MYTDALSFLQDERESWRPFEALADLTDEQLAVPVDQAGGWSGRDLMAHLAAWQQHALDVARELALGDDSPEMARMAAEWESRGGDAVNAEIRYRWRALPMEELRRRFATIPGELRGYLTTVPEVRWIKNGHRLEFFLSETIDHYADHEKELEAVLGAVG